MKPLLIGQAPGPNTLPEYPLYPLPSTSAGGRLAASMGLSQRQYLRAFDRMNLLREFPGSWKQGDRWPVQLARVAAQAAEPLLRGRSVVFVGRKVAYAFGAGHVPWFTWFEEPLFGYAATVVPHPSGRNHWYNNPENRALALEFWKDHFASRGVLPFAENRNMLGSSTSEEVCKPTQEKEL